MTDHQTQLAVCGVLFNDFDGVQPCGRIKGHRGAHTRDPIGRERQVMEAGAKARARMGFRSVPDPDDGSSSGDQLVSEARLQTFPVCWADGCEAEGIWCVPGGNFKTEEFFEARFCDEHRAPAQAGELAWTRP